MKKLMAVVLGAAALGGCSFTMKEFSSTPLYSGSEVHFTGAVEDRINLWPVAYWREPVGSIAWPLVSWGKEHFALRPIYSQYKQGGSGDYDEFNFLWPISQFDTKHDDYRFFPFFWGNLKNGRDPYYCLFPLMWHNREFSGVFPFFWLNGRSDYTGFTLFPLYWHGHDSDSKDGSTFDMLLLTYCYERKFGRRDDVSFWALCKLAGYRRSGDETPQHWIFPLYYYDKDAFVTPIFGKTPKANWTVPLYYKDDEKFLTLLGGKSGDADWVVPFYWRDKETFASLAYWQKRGKDGKIDSAFSLPLLSGYHRDEKSGDRLLYMLMGFGGHVWNDETGGANWVFPLYYSDRESFYTLLYGHNPRRTWLLPFYFDGEERTYITPLYGRNKKKESEWLIPLYWRDKDSFVTPLYGRSEGTEWLLPLYTRNEEGVNTIPFSYWDSAKKGTRGFFSLPILSGASWETNSCEYTWVSLAGLVGGTSNATGKRKSQWAVPLYYRDQDSFYSIPFGYEGGGAYTNTYFAAGLAGVRSGKTEGGWLFPIYNKEKYRDFDECLTVLDAKKLPDSIEIWTEIRTNSVWNGKTRDYDKVVGPEKFATSINSFDMRTLLLVSDNDKSIYGDRSWDDKNKYSVSVHHKLGNIFVFRHEGKRKVYFDMDTREKVSDTEKGWSALFGILYNYSHRADRMKGESYTSHRVLWKLWDWEEENGDVSLDVFPGFTYDSKKNGYSKTSFLWRLFRYENDPEKGKKVDLLFIPVWR